MNAFLALMMLILERLLKYWDIRHHDPADIWNSWIVTQDNLAREHEVTVTAHLSYPDRENFGRKSMDISPSRLRTSLAEQHALLPEIRTVKFHGALYNESCRRDDLAAVLTDWLLRAGITAVVTMPDSALARTCTQAGITVLAEASEPTRVFTPWMKRCTRRKESSDGAR